MKRGMNGNTPEPSQFTEISTLIEQATGAVVSQANYALTLLFWNIGKRVHEVILQNQRADYGKQIVVTLARQLCWSHFLMLLPLKTIEAKLFYAQGSRFWDFKRERQPLAGKACIRIATATIVYSYGGTRPEQKNDA